MSDLFIALVVVSLFGSGLVLKMLTSRLDRIETDIRIVEGQINEAAKAVVDLKAHIAYIGAVYRNEISGELEHFDRRLEIVQEAAGIGKAHDTKILVGKKKLLRTLQENLLKLQQRRAEAGLHVSIELENDIESHQYAIKRLQTELSERYSQGDTGTDS